MQRAVVAEASVLGIMHAVFVRRRGVEVVQLEAARVPRETPVRNFGLIWVSGRRSGAELEAARRARRPWEEIALDVPEVGLRGHGSLTAAFDGTERKAMA